MLDVQQSGTPARKLPMKKPPFKAVVEQSPETDDRRPRFLRNMNDPEDIVDVHGYKTVTKGGRPRPQVATVGMHLANAFAALGGVNSDSKIAEDGKIEGAEDDEDACNKRRIKAEVTPSVQCLFKFPWQISGISRYRDTIF